jgi:hypothetical protein
MATMNLMTLLDLRSSVQTVEGGIIRLAEVLVEENEALADIPWSAGNLLTGDIHYKRTAMPTAHRRNINQGVKASISKKEAETDTCIEIVSRSVVDMKELAIASDAAAYLALEDRPHIAILGETVVRVIFNGESAGGVLGLRTRYNKLSGEKAKQVIDAGGLAGKNLQSIYIVKWSPEEVTGIYPKNTTMGLQVAAFKDQFVPDKDNETFRAYITEYSQFIGLKVRDHRYVARICNIDIDDISTDAAARQALFRHLITAKNRIFHVSQGRVVMYMSPELANIIELAAFEKENTVVGYKDGMTSDTRILTFSGIPIRKNDFQSEVETKVL